MTAKELAARLGVSEATVSMALNGKPGVSEKTRKRVLEAARDCQISPKTDLTAPSQKVLLLTFHHRMTMISSAAFTNDVIVGIEKTCNEQNLVLSSRTVYGTEALVQTFQEAEKDGAAGIILMSPAMVREDFELLPRMSIPVVLLDNHAFSCPINAVKIDNTGSAFEAVHFLIARTRQTPGYLRSSLELNNFKERETGYLQALSYHGMSIHTGLIHDLTPSVDGAFADMSAILKKGTPLASCYFADNDLIAIGAMQAMTAFGIKIPEEVSIIGFDDIEMSSHTVPPLTTMHVPKYHLGATAVKRLVTLMRDGSLFPVKTEISARLIIRESIR